MTDSVENPEEFDLGEDSSEILCKRSFDKDSKPKNITVEYENDDGNTIRLKTSKCLMDLRTV